MLVTKKRDVLGSSLTGCGVPQMTEGKMADREKAFSNVDFSNAFFITTVTATKSNRKSFNVLRATAQDFGKEAGIHLREIGNVLQ